LAVDRFVRSGAEEISWSGVDLSLLYSSWSYFMIAPAPLPRVVDFDPRFPGNGFEALNYTARSGLADVGIAEHQCGYIRHQDQKPEATSIKDISGGGWGKYTSANQVHFADQWETCLPGDGVFIKQLHGHVRPRRPVAPLALAPIPAEAWAGSLLYAHRRS
jgi:hypothetical protein